MVISGLGIQCTPLSHLMIKDKSMIKYVNESASPRPDAHGALSMARPGTSVTPLRTFSSPGFLQASYFVLKSSG